MRGAGWRLAVAACGLSLLALLAPTVHAATATPTPGPAIGDVAPDVLGRDGDGDPVRLQAHAGKVVVVTFWATWCPYCLKELPVLDGVQKAAGAQHLQVVAVDVESREVFKQVRRALKPLSIQLAYDPGQEAQKAYGVHSYPHLVIIGRDGKVQQVFHGYGEDSLDEILAAINHATGAAP